MSPSVALAALAALAILTPFTAVAGASAPSPGVAPLADEVRSLGWIVFPAPSERGDWDLFLMRPDGSQRHALTQTPEWNEAAPQFSRDGERLLYRRLKRGEKIEGNRYGEQGELVVANSSGGGERVIGGDGELPWASWSPDGREIATLSIKGVAFVEVETSKVLRTLARQGFFQQLTWSPDGRWLCGVANSFGTGWSVARMDAATGQVAPVNTVDCCTPDWFPNSSTVIFSWRPPGQKANRGIGWTQLWRVDARGTERHLVYGEDGRHIYGGHVSPDGRYALFTGNPEEDGDPQHGGAPMGLLRLSDAPLVGGQSHDLRALHPDAKSGPVLVLPTGWEPAWTFSEKPAGRTQVEKRVDGGEPPPLRLEGRTQSPASLNRDGQESVRPHESSLATELHARGWIVFSSQTPRGDWDLFLMRPDGSGRRALTETAGFNEAGARFSPDGKRLLYYRMAASDVVDNNTYGTFDLVLADSDGKNPVVYGADFPWASWGPDGTQLACLKSKGIQIVDVESRRVLRTIPRQGLVQQLVWSPDGKAFAGTANGLGPFWNIGRLVEAGDKLEAVSETDRYNCTPDWCPDSRHILYARGIVPKQDGRAQLWIASTDGRERHPLHAEDDRHIYGACAAPDAKYLLFTRSVGDLGAVTNSQTTLAVIRWPGAEKPDSPPPASGGVAPGGDATPWLDLGPGWEPHWTYSETPAAR